MSSSIQYGTSGLGIHFSPPETKTYLMNHESQKVDSRQISTPGGCPTDKLGPVLTSESLQSRRRGTVEQDLSSDTDASANFCESSGNSGSAENALVTNDNEADWKGSEIDTVLGNAKSRLKSGARLLPQTPGEQKGVALEKTKRRARVDVDIYLRNDICVEGGYLQGLVKIRVRESRKKSQSTLLSGGKIRVVGFESITNEEERFTFYQCSADLSDVSSGLDVIYSSEPDADGFMKAKEGVHVLPFTFQLTASQVQGKPKGPVHTQSGISVRYIAMISFRTKDTTSGKTSIAHFYRDCSVWPRLNPSVVLSPTSRPIQVTVSEGLVMGGNGKVNLTASLHRLHWVAGQLCHVRFDVVNNSKKSLKLLSLELFQTITTFKAKNLSGSEQSNDIKQDAFQSIATKKQIAQSTLITGDGGTRGHASAKGWWMGVPAGSSQIFSHSILLPAYALSIPRGRLLEVSYTLQATISTRGLLSTDVNVSVPLEIINFLSIDPPPGIAAESDAKRPATEEWKKTSSNATGNGSRAENDDNRSTDSEDDYISECDSDGLGNLSVHDDTDEVVRHVVSSARIDVEDVPRFADLYYSSKQEHLGETSVEKPIQEKSNCGILAGDSGNQTKGTPIIQHEEPRKPSSFPARVEEKIAKRKIALNEALHVNEVAIRETGTQTALTAVELAPTGSRRDRLRAESLVSSAGRPVGLSSLLSNINAPKPVTLPSNSSAQNSVESIVTTSATTRVSNRLSNRSDNTSSVPAQSQILQVPLTDSPSTIGSREVSVSDIIDAYIQPSRGKEHLAHTVAPSHHDNQDIEKPGMTGNSRPYSAKSDPVTPTRRLSIDMLANSGLRPKSVRDKIRELEELTARATADS